MRPGPREGAQHVNTRRSIPSAVRWSFYLFVFTIPLERADLPFVSVSFTLAKMFGFVFFATFSFFHIPIFHKRSFPDILPAMACFLVFATVYFLNIVAVPEVPEVFGFRESVSSLFRLIQLIVLFWIASSLLRDEKVAKNALIAYSVGCGIIAVGMIWGTALSTRLETQFGERVVALGEDANFLAAKLAIGAVILIGLLLHRIIQGLCIRGLTIGLLLTLLGATVATASRGGLLALVLGLWVYVLSLPAGKTKQIQNVAIWIKRPRTRLILLIFSAAPLVFFILYNPVALSRWSATLVEGRMSGREKIIPVAMEMVLERPFIGWHPKMVKYKLGERLGVWQKGTHNLYFFVFLAVGAVGAAPFLVGLWLCLRAAWKGRRGNMGGTALASVVAVLAVNLSIDFLDQKPMWLVLAFAVASAFHVPSEYATRRMKQHIAVGLRRMSSVCYS